MSDSLVIDGAHGAIHVPGGTISALATRAAESVAGARVRRRGVDVKIDGGGARARLELNASRGVVLPELGRSVQAEVARVLGTTCGLAPVTVDLHIEELE